MDAASDYSLSGLMKARAIRNQLDLIIKEHQLFALYQPIVNLSDGSVLGYEGLIRGPLNTELHAPLVLFGVARECGLALELEHLSRSIVMESFAKLGLPGRLFLNVSPDTLILEGRREEETLRCISDSKLQPKQIVIELTENAPAMDYSQLRRAADHYRSIGFQIAMDDLGEGFSSLRLWSELRPDFVKIDKHFIQGLQLEPMKLHFVRSIQEIASNSGCKVIAEGIEQHAELLAIREVGIANGQGYLFAKPLEKPPSAISPEIREVLQDNSVVLNVSAQHFINKSKNIVKLLKCVQPVSVAHSNEEVFQMFESNPSLFSIPVIDGETPVGLISRYSMIDRFARPFRKELYGRKSCRMLMDEAPLIVDVGVTIHELSSLILNMAPYHLAAGFIITDQGRYVGIGSGHDLLREITQMQITAARYANPLTMLPGNVPINEQIDSMLKAGQTFHTCYFDLDNFKPYNDVYGFRKGDEIIKLTGRLLEAACDQKSDFVGHIGGDDFIVLFSSPDWELRCRQILDQFALVIKDYYSAADAERGGIEVEDRQGRVCFQPFISLSIGAVNILPGEHHSHHEVATAATRAKKQAKKISGNSLFLERRGMYQSSIIQAAIS